LKIPCISHSSSRLLGALRSQRIHPYVHFYSTIDVHERSVLFWEYVGDNYVNFKHMLTMSEHTDLMVVVDDTYEGLLDQAQLDVIIQDIEKYTKNYIIYSSNEKLQGDRVYFFSYHLFYANYDNIDVQKDKVEFNTLPRSRKFLCLNRQPRWHRYEIVDFLIRNNMLEGNYISCGLMEGDVLLSENTASRTMIENYRKKDYLDSDIIEHDLPERTAERLSKHLPLNLDVNEVDRANITLRRHMPNLEKYFQDSYWSIITERDFYSDDYRGWTEKVLKAFFYGHPFIVVGLPGTLASLQKMGFITFGAFIDESYDREEDHKTRMKMIQEQILRLNSLNHAEHYNLYQRMLPLLQHNRQMYLEQNRSYIPSKLINKVLEWYYRDCNLDDTASLDAL